ncbi:MAG: hypothetical protein COW63_02605 [Bacteroidetes bacterium CG18_big_fil_WC_8_21_14_2_50_41_14]|nr:MAG: hypothetical protein COW63_02605 [Bacteroidetes bacterium CG18_big_fil_WC_8_21_14_2_50_41_14]PIY30798.1 MAG: hypothetical protein COZ08_10870 [Bacteroidetes bacterium CG_4_10_14_3_um_filter_42_6]PJB54759.1 MAG: hypothetical protein CO098_19965 [Bacteroidetes bacterium CG_4_9_14_3_um_filter_41_19]
MGHYELTSYFIYRSTVYSDGKIEHDGSFFEDKTIVVCPHCEGVFWRDEAKEKEIEYQDDQPELPFSKSVWDLEMARSEDFRKGMVLYYKQLLETGFANTTQREIYLRITLWRAINDIIRYQRPFLKSIDSYVLRKPLRFLKSRISTCRTYGYFKPNQLENLHRLTNIFSPVTDDDQLMLTEMYREMGNRSKALELLNSIENGSGATFRKIKKATLLFRKRVFMLGK